MLLWLCAAVLVQSLDLDSTSFTSPLFPDHSRKFYMLGSSIPLRASVRVIPPSARKSGAIVALNPIQDPEVVIQVNGTHAGKAQTDDEGTMTMWLSPNYGRHIAVGSFFGVSPRIQGVLVVYDFRKGLLGYEKMQEEAVSQEEVGKQHHCAYPPSTSFNFTLTIAANSLRLHYVHNNQQVFCFQMPIAPTPERFLGLSATSSFPCQRGVEIFSLTTSIEVNTQRFIAKMTSENAKLEGILGKIVDEYKVAIEGLRPIVQVPDKDTIHDKIKEISTRINQTSSRVVEWKEKYEALIAGEKDNDKGKIYYAALENTVKELEAQLQSLMQAASSLNLGAIIEDYVRYQGELMGNERHIGQLVSEVQRNIGGYEEVARKEGGMWAVYGGMLTLLGVGGYLYWSYSKAKKRHDI